MTAPFNGILLNGGIPHATWAWGFVHSEAVATIQPVVSSIHRYVEGALVPESVTTSSSTRYVMLESTVTAYAEGTGFSTRLAGYSGASLAESEIKLFPFGTVWVKGVTEEQDAVSLAWAEKWKYTQAVIEPSADTTLGANYVTAYRTLKGKVVPSQARSWMAESSIKRLKVRQVAFKGNGIVRSNSRALANTAIGFSVLHGYAEASLDGNLLKVTHGFKGHTASFAEALLNPARVRISIGDMFSEAYLLAEPTITRADGRFSFNSGSDVGLSSSIGKNRVLRGIFPVSSHVEAGGLGKIGFLVRGVTGENEGVARLIAYPSISTRYRMKALAVAEASGVGRPVRRRWTPISPAAALATAEGVVVPYVASYRWEVDFICTAKTAAEMRVLRKVEHKNTSPASASLIHATRLGVMTGRAFGDGTLDIEATRLAKMQLESQGESSALASLKRTAGVSGTSGSIGEARLLSQRTARMLPSSVVGSATASLQNTRLAYLGAEVLGSSELIGAAIRSAYLGSTIDVSADSTGKGVRFAYLKGLTENQSNLVGDSNRTAWMASSESEGYADSYAWFRKNVSLKDEIGIASSAVGIDVDIYHWVWLPKESVMAGADETAIQLRWVYFDAEDVIADGASSKFLYRINVDSDAPDTRVVFIKGSFRSVEIPLNNREYLIK